MHLTGYKLQGAHQKLDCKECHQSKFIAEKKNAEKEYTYMGLEPKCVSCHYRCSSANTFVQL